MKPDLPQLTVVVKSSLADIGVASRKKLQVALYSVLLSQTEQILIKISNYIEYLEDTKY
jgi:hypothetical protein